MSDLETLPVRLDRTHRPVGTWLSLVEHSLGVRGVGSSNLPVPTKLSHQFAVHERSLARDDDRRENPLVLIVSRPVLDPDRRAHESKRRANLVLQKALIREVQLYRAVGEEDE